MSDQENRELGPEMSAERWWIIGGDSIMWCHEPSHRCVTVNGPSPRRSRSYDCTGVPALHGEPADPATEGYLVGWARHDDGGEPYEGDRFWVESYGEALRYAREIRKRILGEQSDVRPVVEQLTLDDVLAAKLGGS